MSWLMAYEVARGRDAVNFSDWASYQPERQPGFAGRVLRLACDAHDISVIAGGCPMMYGDDVDFGDTCLRLFLKLTAGLPT